MWAEDHDRLDSVIDAVTREMTAGTPGAEFRARVLARIREPQSLWRWRWVLLPPAATAIVLLAVALYDGRPIHRDAAPAAARPGTRQPGSVPVESTTVAIGSSATEAPPAHATHRDAGTSAGGRGTAPGLRPTASSSELDELAPPPIAVDSIAVDRLATPEPLTVQHLEISSIALAPIDAGDRQ